uniref:UDP-N-acetylglucosamine--dolichyl-phosphate N-acetylglucosaminephosphotransferase n=1 Tax=Panagrellus redivivus TaxID=6233 RepID=A0A7E4ZU20_PANRE
MDQPLNSEANSSNEEYIVETVVVNVFLSLIAGYLAHYLMKEYIPIFKQRGLFGKDMCKLNSGDIPEPMGVIAAAVYLIFVFLFISVPFIVWVQDSSGFPYVRLLSLLGGVISICAAILLGFVDDILDLRWRHKLLFPTLSSVPLLIVYKLSGHSTAMLLPKFIQPFIGTTYLDIGPLFYIYMGMLVIFCTNAINIIAGINGVEAGQGIVLGASIAIFNVIQIARLDVEEGWYHSLSLCLLLPFIATSVALYSLNRYPAKVFVGDTYCYWAGMLLAVVGILGHFSKTLLIFCVPQVFNFLYSIPQLFHFVPCPRHRLPRFDRDGDKKLHISVAEFEPEKISKLATIMVVTLRMTKLLKYEEFQKDGARWARINNLTILNLILKFTGPLYEYQLNNVFLGLQIACSALAFVGRFYFASFLYDEVH